MAGKRVPRGASFKAKVALAAARFDYNVRMLRWMERYLQGPGGEAPDLAIDYAEEFGEE